MRILQKKKVLLVKFEFNIYKSNLEDQNEVARHEFTIYSGLFGVSVYLFLASSDSIFFFQ